jgi:hypothetical protein
LAEQEVVQPLVTDIGVQASDKELLELTKKLPAASLPAWAISAVWLLLATAARSGELLNARWD